MKKMTKILLIIAAVIICGVAAMGVLGVKMLNLFNFETETKTFDISEEFTGISVETESEDITFAASKDGGCKVVCELKKGSYRSVAAENGTLKISTTENKKWYEKINFFSFADERITVYLPDKEYSFLSLSAGTGNISVNKGLQFERATFDASTGNLNFGAAVKNELKADLSTGNININETSCGALSLKISTGNINVNSAVCTGDAEIKLSTGKVNVNGMVCNSLVSTGSTGDIALFRVTASGSFNIKRSTGDVLFDSCDAGSVTVKTSTGDVTGTFKSDKVFITETSTGDIKVPESITGGKCKVTTSTGDIILDVIK